MQTVLGVVFPNQWSHLLYGLVVGSGSARLYRLVSAREVSTAVEVRPDLVSRQDLSRDLCVRGGEEGSLLGCDAESCSCLMEAEMAPDPAPTHVGVLSGPLTGPVVYGRIYATYVSVCESLSLFLRFSKTARERLSFGLGRGGVALGPSYHPSAGEGSLIHHWFGGGSNELFAWLGGGFKRCVTLRTTRALVCYSGDDPRNPGIRGNKESLTFSGLSSIVENTNQFLRNFERRTSGMYRI
ncbi:hypothetical protein DY000_02029096 [Brassica cretica]|uniref:Uncharacterized protein n=1 Tax=Brassica cretica TaxID=69181 RepID=A0ABQ7DQC5_BRACR|nr:hypothetical protein DY000_02029096 [Brassica cretica]